MSRPNLSQRSTGFDAVLSRIRYAEGCEPGGKYHPAESGATAGLSRALERANNGSMTAHVAAMRTRGMLPAAPTATASRPAPKPKAAAKWPDGPMGRIKALSTSVMAAPESERETRALQAFTLLCDPDLSKLSPSGMVKALSAMPGRISEAEKDRLRASLKANATAEQATSTRSSVRDSWDRAHAAARGELHEDRPDPHGWSAVIAEMHERRHPTPTTKAQGSASTSKPGDGWSKAYSARADRNAAVMGTPEKDQHGWAEIHAQVRVLRGL